MRVSFKALCLGGLAFTLAEATLSHADDNAPTGQVTFHKDISPIFQKNCQNCHRPGGANLGGMVAPMSLVTYDETRPWVKSIASKVKAREMPPWHASKEQSGLFKGERALTDDQVTLIVKWAESGALPGDPKDAPAPITFPGGSSGWQIGEPDLIVKIPKPYFVSDDVVDVQPTFTSVLSEKELPEDRWIKAVEFRPGCKVLHHILAFPLGGLAPGNQPTIFSDDYGQLFPKGSNITWNMHYHKEAGPGTGVWDESSVGIKFYPKGQTPKFSLQSALLTNFMINIPAGADNHPVTASYVLPFESQLLAYAPHMHVRGKSARYVAIPPGGKEEVLLDVPKYDYNWQTTYAYKQPKVFPKGTTVKVTGLFDNSTNNPHNPDPTANVKFGEKTTDEMMFGFMLFAAVDPKDAPPPGQGPALALPPGVGKPNAQGLSPALNPAFKN